jgi:signal transduction histidine kinase
MSPNIIRDITNTCQVAKNRPTKSFLPKSPVPNTSPFTFSHPVATLYTPSKPANLFRSLIRQVTSVPIEPAILPEIVQKHTGQFATALAHEVRNPLSNINLAVEMLKTSMKTEEQNIFLDIILRGSGRINDLVTDLLASTQIDEQHLEKHSVHQLLNESLAMNNDRILMKNILVRKDYTTLDCMVLVNKEKMKIALTNIIVNAIDAMPLGKGKLKLLTRSMNNMCFIEIQDNGIGISKENLKNIFKPYFTRKPSGLGLGLSTTLDILKANHTGVNVQSEEGRGTNFILSFDRCPEA